MAFNLKNITQKIGIDKDQDLLEAARNGKNDVIERMLKKRQSSSSTILSSFLKQGNINCVDREGDTPLHLAALNGHKGSVEILLRENALVNIQDLMGCSPLHLAAWKGYSDICLLLVSNVNEMIQVNLQNNAGETALHNAAQFGYASTVEVLLQHNADPTIRNLKDDSPLDLAARFGRMDVVQCLINKYPELVNSNIMNHSPLHLAAACGHLQIVVILLDAGYKINTKTENGTALHVSALYCKTDIVRLLLERGIDYNEVDKDGLTVLQILQEHEKTQTSYTEIVSIISGFIEEKNNSAKNVDESDSAAAYDTLVVHHPKPKPRPRTSPGSPLYAKPHKDKIKSTEEVTPLADPVTTPTEPPPIPPRLSSIDLPAETSPVHSTIAEAREASLLMENLKPFVSPFSENTAGEEQPVSHNSPPLPPKVSASSRRGVVSMIERASDFKASPKVQSISSAAPWKSEANLLDDSLPPPKPCDADGARTDSYLDMGSSVSPGKQKPIKPPRLKKSPTPVRSNVGKKSTEPSANIPQSDGSIKKPEPKEARVTQGATGKTTKSTLAPEDYEIMANVDKKVQGETKEEKHDNYMTAFSVKRTEKVEENSKPTVGENISRKSEGFETKSLSYNPKVEDKVVSVEYENSANIGNIRKDDVVEYQNTKTNQVSTSHDEGAKSESMYIPNDNIPADDNGNILQSDIPKMHNSDEKISFNVSKDAAFADSFTKSSICDINCDRKQGSDDQSFRVESGNHGDRDKQHLSNGSSESHDDSRASATKPSSLPFEAYASGPMKSLPLSPTLYHQPPTPDHPPPSPHTAMLGIHQKIIIDNKRSSKDIETITEDCLMADDIPKVADSPDDLDNSKTDSQSEREVKVNIEGEEDVVVMRKSRASIGSLDDLVTSDSLRPFEGLLRGSVIGKPRKLASQLSDNAHRSVQRKTLQTSNTTIDPVAEEDFNVQKVMAALAMTTQETRSPKLSDDHESEDEWAQIADIMASFGGGITRESVFVREYEDKFTKQLSKDILESNKIQSVGDWLEEVGLGQYENTLVANGFDDTDFLGEKIMDDQDLELIGVTVADHRKKILDTAKSLPQIIPIDPDNPPASVEDWLTSLHLRDYFDTFIAKKMDTMERVLKLWEVELTSVLDISALGHRKRILSSLEKRSTIDRQFSSLKKRSKDHTDNTHVPFKDINLYKDYTKVKPITSSEEDIKESSQNTFPPVDSSEDEDVFRKDSQGKAIRDSTIHLRPPHQAHTASPIKQWRHRPEMLIKGCCNYTAQYLGSTLVKELCGTESTREGITKLKKSSDVIAKIPTIMLSISYKGVKFIDAKSKKVICDHEIGNIFCACQDADSMNFFAYITRDNQTAKHYCHVFNVRNPVARVDMAREIILTLGEAFEVAYQMALKEKAANEAQEFERKLSQSDREDSVSISSKASVNTV